MHFVTHHFRIGFLGGSIDDRFKDRNPNTFITPNYDIRFDIKNFPILDEKSGYNELETM